MTVNLTASWRCLAPDCDAAGDGTPTICHRDARRHAEKPPKHPTSLSCRPAKETR